MATKCDDLTHCWHVTQSNTDGLGQKGWDAETCCWCGQRRKNHWQIQRDPSHGPHVPESKIIRDVKHDYEPAGRKMVR